jgi:hypothetical protein
MNARSSIKNLFFTPKLQGKIWSFGLFYWVSSFVHRSFKFAVDGSLSGTELMNLLAVFLLLSGWICLKPQANLASENLDADDISTLKHYKLDSTIAPHEAYLHKAESRMLHLERYHMISQEYVLPIPYRCQIYHLLDLKHLESVHGFSLRGLRIVNVHKLQITETGGVIKFQTVLDSPLNLLRIWRQPIVEVDLIMHTPYTIELSIPIYEHKKITVIFNILPLSNNDHKLFIDIYSDIMFPRMPLQILLHLASSLTLLEDLPYLRKLAESKIHCLNEIGKRSHHETRQMFERFIDLYGSSLEQPQSTGAVKLQSGRVNATGCPILISNK